MQWADQFTVVQWDNWKCYVLKWLFYFILIYVLNMYFNTCLFSFSVLISNSWAHIILTIRTRTRILVLIMTVGITILILQISFLLSTCYLCCYFRLKVVHVVGKRHRPVPILLTGDMVDSMEALLNTRSMCITPTNKYFFALSHSTGHLSFYTVLKSVAKRAGLKRPDLLSTTRMRKYLATMAQVGTGQDSASSYYKQFYVIVYILLAKNHIHTHLRPLFVF